MTLILSLHIPKAAGTTLIHAYRNAFGDRVLYHNAHPDIVYTTPRVDLEKSYDIIHGHLDMSRLVEMIDADTKIVTFLRDPVQRVVSSYQYHLNPQVQNDIATLVRSTNMGLMEFADMPGQKDLQSRMIRPVGRHRLDFIGFSETFRASLEQLSRCIGVALSNPGEENVNPQKRAGADYSIPEHVRDYIRSRNAQDQELYDWARARAPAMR